MFVEHNGMAQPQSRNRMKWCAQFENRIKLVCAGVGAERRRRPLRACLIPSCQFSRFRHQLGMEAPCLPRKHALAGKHWELCSHHGLPGSWVLHLSNPPCVTL